MAENYPFNLGRHTRTVSTHSDEAQRWFDFGLNWCFGFNHEEAVKCFQKALNADPNCVMAHWGAAYASGPFYNLVWRDFGKREAAVAIARAHAHISQAQTLTTHATTVENRLVTALAARFQAPHPVPPADYDHWDDDYAAAMRLVHRDFPNNHDVMALSVEALITRTPCRLWDVKTGQPAAGADTIEALAICEKSIALADAAGVAQHPAILHFHIHVLEMSHTPERALPSADVLATLCPDAGHLSHMPAHIYVICGEYEKARIASERAIRADDAYVDYAGSTNFYVTACCHNIHMMMYICMFLGQYEPAMAAVEKMQRVLTRDILAVQDRPKLAMLTEGFYAMTIHVLVRFGRWQDIIGTPLPDDPQLFLLTTAMHHYARGVAYASIKNIPQAEQERALFHKSLSRIPPERLFLNDPALTMLAVGEKMLDGEIAYHKGAHDEAYANLRDSVQRDDNLSYTEPWAWMHPPRHALAALLLEQGHVAEAEQVYRDDLGLSEELQRCSQRPNNVWALHGLVECLKRRGDTDELPALQQYLARAMQIADTAITSSCMCRTSAACGQRLDK
jgi:tetratricopeptide (TPR) repeat protein